MSVTLLFSRSSPASLLSTRVAATELIGSLNCAPFAGTVDTTAGDLVTWVKLTRIGPPALPIESCVITLIVYSPSAGPSAVTASTKFRVSGSSLSSSPSTGSPSGPINSNEQAPRSTPADESAAPSVRTTTTRSMGMVTTSPLAGSVEAISGGVVSYTKLNVYGSVGWEPRISPGSTEIS